MPSMDSMLASRQSHDPHLAGAYEARPPRRRTCLNGKLVYGDGAFTPDGAFTLDCAIHDISEGGAKVILTKRQAVPPDLYLIVIKHCVAYQAKVVWLEFPARGLKFSKTYALNAPLPEELKFLRKLWGDLYARSGEILPS
jgi:hypothetical protein